MEFQRPIVRDTYGQLDLVFKIKNFKDSPISNARKKRRSRFVTQRLIVKEIDVCLSVHGSGERPENKDYVVYRIKKCFFRTDREHYVPPPAPVCSFTCIIAILDVEGRKKFPQTLTLVNNSEDPSDESEERYIERSCILNNASEYLQEEDTLTVVVEGNLKGWDAYDCYAMRKWFPPNNFAQFETEHVEHNLKVYLLKRSGHFENLLRHSRVFQDMMKHPMRERKEERVLLRNEELPAFLCMLFFLDTENLLLYRTTISDLYKIAHYYDIQVLLEECRKYIRTILQVSWQPLHFAIRKFATDYRDDELKSTAEVYIQRHSEQMQESNANLEMRNEFGDDIGWNTPPVSSNSMKTKGDFRRHLTNLWKKIANHTTEQVLDFNELQMESKRETFDFYQ